MNFGLLEFLTLAGSLGLFIYGMKVTSEGLQKVAGGRMRGVLRAMTSNRFMGVLTGAISTTVIQSSSASTVMVVSFVNAGLLKVRQAISVIMGANIGTTVKA
ncbi:MAG: Na/Pi symporter, partial [Flavobacteriales bacterium]